MAVREMKMIPDEIGVVSLALLVLRIGIEFGDGHCVCVKSPQRNVFPFQRAVCGLFTLVSTHNSYLLNSTEIAKQAFLVDEILATDTLTCSERFDLALCYQHTDRMLGDTFDQRGTLLDSQHSDRLCRSFDRL